MKISVIIPCYNAEKYLHECLASLQSQTFSDFEAVVIDDGSTDRTPEIVRGFAANDRRFILLSEENAGVSAARNRGLNAAKGEWIFFLDSDDVLPQDSLQTLIHFESDDVDMIVGSHCIFDGQHEEKIRPTGNWICLKGEKKKDAIIKRLIEGDSVLNIMCNKLHRRSVLNQHDIRLNRGVRIAEDALFNLEMTFVSRGVAFSSDVTYRYRMHEASAMHKGNHLSNYDLHLPWLLALRQLLISRNQMKNYYTCFLDTVTLRLYKDGGVPAVFAGWFTKIRPLVTDPAIQPQKLLFPNKIIYKLAETNLYRALIPFFFAIRILKWKKEEFSSLLFE